MMLEEYMTIGSIITAHDAWLMIRGLRTLELRESVFSRDKTLLGENNRKLNLYPTLKSNPQYDLRKNK